MTIREVQNPYEHDGKTYVSVALEGGMGTRREKTGEQLPTTTDNNNT